MLQFSEFVWALSYSVWDFFNNFLFIDATDRSKISSDQKRFFIALILYLLSFFANTPFKRINTNAHTTPYAESISAWSNQGLVMCLLSILNQYKYYSGNIYLSIYLIIQSELYFNCAVNKRKYVLLLKQ